MDQIRQRYRFLLVSILVLYLALVFIRLGTTSLWLDEIMSLDFCDGNLKELVQNLQQDVHAPLFYLVLMVFIRIGGISEWLGRVPGVLAGAGCILALFHLGKELKDRRFALLSCLLLGLSPFFLEFSREVHPYSLSALLSVLSWYYYLRLMKKGDKLYALGYGLTTGLLLLTFYLTVLVVISQFFLFLFLRISSRKKRLFFLGWAGAALVFSVWLPVFVRQFMTNKISHVVEVFFPEGIKMNHVSLLLAHIFLGAGGLRLNVFPRSIAILILVLSGIISLLERGKIQKRAAARKQFPMTIVYWMFWGQFLFFTLLCLIKPLYLSRYMTMSAPFAVLFLAWQIASMRGWVKYLILCVFIPWSLFSYGIYLKNLPREDWRGAAQYLISHAQPEDVIVSDHVSAVSCLIYYFKIFKRTDLNDNVFAYQQYYKLTAGAYPFENRTLWYLTKRVGRNDRLIQLRDKNIPLSHISFLQDFEVYSFKGKGIEWT